MTRSSGKSNRRRRSNVENDKENGATREQGDTLKDAHSMKQRREQVKKRRRKKSKMGPKKCALPPLPLRDKAAILLNTFPKSLIGKANMLFTFKSTSETPFSRVNVVNRIIFKSHAESSSKIVVSAAIQNAARKLFGLFGETSRNEFETKLAVFGRHLSNADGLWKDALLCTAFSNAVGVLQAARAIYHSCGVT